MRRGSVDEGAFGGLLLLLVLGLSLSSRQAGADEGRPSTPVDAPPAPAPSGQADPIPPGPEPFPPLPRAVPSAERSPVIDPPPPDAVLEPTKQVQDNFVPAALRLPRVEASIDFSLLARSSPRGVDGKMQQAGEKGFRFDEASVPLGPGGLMLGASLGVTAVYADRWILRTLSLDLVHSIGSRPRLLSGRSGSVVSSETWTSFQAGMTLLGIGVRGKHRRWAGSLVLEPGFVWQVTSVSAPAYDVVAEGTATAWSPRLQLAANGCRRLDPTLRLCLSVTPHVYALGLFNGFTLGFRTEIGP